MNEYVEYRSSLCSLKNLLGLGCFHILEKEELMPYITRILSKINEWLILEDKEGIEDNIRLLIGYYEDGLDKIVEPGRMTELLDDYGYSKDDPEFKQKLFLVSWTNVFTTIYLEELYNYAYLFTDTPIDCHECCGSIGEDEEGNTVFTPRQTNLSSPYVGHCGCGN